VLGERERERSIVHLTKHRKGIMKGAKRFEITQLFKERTNFTFSHSNSKMKLGESSSLYIYEQQLINPLHRPPDIHLHRHPKCN